MRRSTQFISAGAVISSCGRYRYRLHRRWGDGSRWVLWVMLNPSTADAESLDPTVRRCVAYSRAWGFDGLMVGNVYAWRSTDPKQLGVVADPVGPDNSLHLVEMAAEASLIVAAWGGKANPYRAADAVAILTRARDVHALKINGDGTPAHPLYLRADLRPVVWQPRRAGFDGGEVVAS